MRVKAQKVYKMLTIFIIGLVYIGTDGDNILAQDITADKVYRKS